MFDLPSVETQLRGTRFAGKLVHYPIVDSTSTLALEAAQLGAHDGVWIADQQIAGRGRAGHTWHSSPDDGLYVSALVTPQLPISDALWLSLATGLAAKTAIGATTPLEADIRWPNDILIGDRKCGGILVETAVGAPVRGGGEAMLRYAVIGIGLNVNHSEFPSDLTTQATSLRIEAGAAPRREELLAALLFALDRELTHLLSEYRKQNTAPSLLDRFTAASTWVSGKAVIVAEDSGYSGITAGLDTRGFLQVRTENGALRTVLSGGVRAR